MSLEQPPNPLKRDHDSFEMESQVGLDDPYTVPPDYLEKLEAEEKGGAVQQPAVQQPTSSPARKHTKLRDSGPAENFTKIEENNTSVQQPAFTLPMPPATNPARSASGSVLSDLAPRTPSYASDSAPTSTASPSAFAAMNGLAPPPSKKVKLTFAEKEMRRIQKDIRDQEQAAEKAKKAAERQAIAEEKARRDAEKEAERKKKEVEREEKKAERLAKEEEKKAERLAKEEKRKEEKLKAEEEKNRKEEEKRKKERSQRTLGSFFKVPAAAPSSTGRSSASPAPEASPATPAKPAKQMMSAYDKLFPEFFVHHDVKVARVNRFERDESATEAISETIDSYISGTRSPDAHRTFNAEELFHLRDAGVLRGKRCMPVREIMAEFSGNASRPIDLTTDSQNSQIKRMSDALRRVPMKFLSFREDVRPPYRGTYTSRPITSIARLARNPLRRDLPNMNYDYDSEAEWVEDEDAEDCMSDGEEEEGEEEGEDMDGFLDDENDELVASRRHVVQGDLEPVSSGLCWENERKRNENVKMMAYRMEIILDPKLKAIDPFSTAYWSPPRKSTSTSMDPPRIPLTTLKPPNGLLPTSASKSTKPLALGAPSSASAKPATKSKPLPLLPQADLPRFKAFVNGNNLSKVGLIEVLKKEFPDATAKAVKGTLEAMARREGAKEMDKRWVVLESEG